MHNLMERMNALPLWAMYAAAGISEQVEADGMVTYRMRAPLKVRLVVEIGEALVRCHEQGIDEWQTAANRRKRRTSSAPARIQPRRQGGGERAHESGVERPPAYHLEETT